MDGVSRWLLITRASVFPMTLSSAAIGGLLAGATPDANWLYFTMALVGLVLAHAANNMINDYKSGAAAGETGSHDLLQSWFGLLPARAVRSK